MDKDHTNPESAQVKPVATISRIWLIPLVALFIGLWMLYYQLSSQGPLITIEFTNASGLESGKTKIKARDVDIGLVENIDLKQDLTGVVVTARISADAAHLVREGSEFWIVEPRVSLRAVSGLNTVLSGTYIAMAPSIQGKSKSEFIALDAPPLTPSGTPGLHVTLNSGEKFAFSEGDPIVYKGLKVGQIDHVHFNLKERIVYYNAFIRAPYHQLITENTKFWNTSGVRLELGASGMTVQTGSLETLLTNGVTFDIPEGMSPGKVIMERAFFDIYPTYEEAASERFQNSADFVVLIDETVRGLRNGAPVEYRGMTIGEVKEINLIGPQPNSLLDKDYHFPVLITIQPGRVMLPDNEAGVEALQSQIQRWVGEGLRVSLKTGNLLTGAVYIDLQHYPDLANEPLTTFEEYTVIPTIAGEFSQLAQKLDNALEEVIATAQSFRQTSADFDQVALSIEQQELVVTVNQALESVAQLTQDFSAGSQSYLEINAALQTLKQTVKEIQPLLQQLKNTPNSLVFAGDAEPDLEPRAKEP